MSERRVVAIHQPTFFPWLGFFDKLARSDVFILLDDVQFARRHGGGGNWVNRVRVLIGGSPGWITAPVKRANVPLQHITQLEIADDMPWRAQLLRVLKAQYAAAPFVRQTMALLTPLVQYPAGLLAEFNEHAIRVLADAVGETPPIVRQSSLGVTGRSTPLLAALVKAVGGTTYLSGDGADDYLEPGVFDSAGIELTFQRFRHPEYTQGTTPFAAGLSIVDALMHCGVDGVRTMVRAGIA